MGKRIRLAFKRRREGKTDYRKRLKLLMSGLPRLVVRKTNKYVIAQVVESKEAKDFTVCYVNSKELSNYGWKKNFKNVAASYLTGLLIGIKAREKGIKKVVPDFGLHRSTKGSKLYAVLKGALEAGLEINCKEEMLPSDERIIQVSKLDKKEFEEIKEKIKENILKLKK